MLAELEQAIKEGMARYEDKRLYYCDLTVKHVADGVGYLQGKVLDEALLTAVTEPLRQQFSSLEWNRDAVHILRQSTPRLAVVATTITGLYAQPSFGAELMTEWLNGRVLEILMEQESWAFVRGLDGYLGWMYLPYLIEEVPPSPTHWVIAPVALLYAQTNEEAELVGRVLGGTAVTVAKVDGRWAWVTLAGGLCGWLVVAGLRPISEWAGLRNGRRSQIIQDAGHWMGVPYFWGGGSALGIDCSGYSQLLHRLVGVELPRDADWQYAAGQPVEPPFLPGDLLFFGGDGYREITHVGMSLGKWRMIHASRRHNGVYVDEVTTMPSLYAVFAGGRRFI